MAGGEAVLAGATIAEGVVVEWVLTEAWGFDTGDNPDITVPNGVTNVGNCAFRGASDDMGDGERGPRNGPL